MPTSSPLEADAQLAKPFDLDVLLETVRELLDLPVKLEES
jgi:hypothetical protein